MRHSFGPFALDEHINHGVNGGQKYVRLAVYQLSELLAVNDTISVLVKQTDELISLMSAYHPK
jgi:hypothetical protein